MSALYWLTVPAGSRFWLGPHLGAQGQRPEAFAEARHIHQLGVIAVARPVQQHIGFRRHGERPVVAQVEAERRDHPAFDTAVAQGASRRQLDVRVQHEAEAAAVAQRVILGMQHQVAHAAGGRGRRGAVHPLGLIQRHAGFQVDAVADPVFEQGAARHRHVGGDAGSAHGAFVEQAQLNLGVALRHGAGAGALAWPVGADGTKIVGPCGQGGQQRQGSQAQSHCGGSGPSTDARI